MTITLSTRSEQLLEELQQAAAAPDPETLVERALEFQHEQLRQLAVLRSELQHAVDQADRGELIDGEEFFPELLGDNSSTAA